MSNAQRQAVTERMRSSPSDLAPTRPEADCSRDPVRDKPAFISVLSSRRSGHTRAHAVAQDANRSQHDDQRQGTA